ncbi:MAG: hypothetical protein ACOC0W_03240 [Desulfosalsimonas sp.]
MPPLQGEATGLIGGYLFGALKKFIYSGIGLAPGSMLNFGLGQKPCTFMLSLQGDLLFGREYLFTALVLGASIVLLFSGYRYRGAL